MRRALLTLLLTLLCATAVQARVYQWVSPETGTVQLSGEPPLWYRSVAGGPRVRVYERGVLVDDTAINLPAERRQALREEAFRDSTARAQSQALRKLDQAVRRQAAREAERARRTRRGRTQGRAQAEDPRAGDEANAAASSALVEDSGQLDAATVQRLKAIITEWDRRNAQPPGGRGDEAGGAVEP
ncbi:MAG: hypothetical protein GWN84_14205 [Gammaproteobacteria bacterium]|nr:hypothetical protein [Gammaproteobacteria bacterium]NIR83952.1 hypothetical protein [Gammaproteobacteria bacterium]NIR88995.1 hypothetical protein [Gammaproteobacteria bacterium]NIV74548.1 hypothetical protein [Gammaproteobacteria bacterium]